MWPQQFSNLVQMHYCLTCALVLASKNLHYYITKQRETIALNRQGTQQQRPELSAATPPGMQANTWYIYTPPRYIFKNSTKGTSSLLQ